MSRVPSLLAYIFTNFGPIIVFYAAQHFYGLKVAILLSVLYATAEIIFKKMKKERLTQFFKISVAVTLLFGAIDLYLKDSIFFKYEASLTNVIFGFYFGMTIFKGKPLIQEFYEQRKGLTGQLAPDLVHFFKLLTGVWAIYFMVKAAFYLWVANHYSFEEALVVRGTVGNISLYGLIFISTMFGRRLYFLAKKLGLLRTQAVA